MGVPPAVIIDIMRQKNYTTTLKHYTKIPSNVLLDTLNQFAERDQKNAVSNVSVISDSNVSVIEQN